MKKYVLLILVALFVGACTTLPTTLPKAVAVLQSGVVAGELPNGLRYFIMPNAKPEKRAHLRLVVNAGSVLETENERGLAHLLEHMAFNGTKNFAKQAIVDYFEKIGMNFGDNLNAYTSFNETVFTLDIPTDKPEILDTSIRILEDWAHNLTLDPEEIRKETGVVQEEWRLGRNVQGRRRDFQVPLLFNGSTYSDRLPIGSMDIVKKATAEQLRQFYETWYRPDNMAVIAVGDVDPKAIETLIRGHFQYPKPTTPLNRPIPAISPYSSGSLHLFSDPELTYNSLSFNEIEQLDFPDFQAAQKNAIMENLVQKLFNKRLDDLVQKPQPPFLNGFLTSSWLTRGYYLRSLSVVPVDNQFDKAIPAFLTEVNRVTTYGFTPTEFKREVAAYQSDLDQAYSQRGEITHQNQSESLQKYFLENRPFPDPQTLYQLRKDLIGQLKLDDLNSYATKILKQANPLVLVAAVEKPGRPLPDQSALEHLIAASANLPVDKPVEKTLGSLMTAVPHPGSIVKTSEIPGLDVQIWDLSNGAKVFLKKTNFKTNEILFSALSPGGTDAVEDKDWINADFAVNFFQESGLGNLTQSDLSNYLSAKQASLSVDMSSLTESLSGSASPGDLETLFQMLYLRQGAPRIDQDAFKASFTQYSEYLKNQAQSPEAAFQEAIHRVLTRDDVRSYQVTPEQLAGYDLAQSAAIYTKKFASAGNFTYAFVGDFDWAKMRTLVETYIASLPAGQKETIRDRGVRPPTKPVHQEVKRGLEPKAIVTLFFTGQAPFSFEGILTAEALTEVLNISLRESIREDLSGTYDVSAQVSLMKFPYESYQAAFSFGCEPGRNKELIAAVQTILDKVSAGDFSDSLLAKFREAKHRSLETDRKTNHYWLSRLIGYTFYGNDYQNLLKIDQLIDQVSHDQVTAMAKAFLDKNTRHEVILLPQSR